MAETHWGTLVGAYFIFLNPRSRKSHYFYVWDLRSMWGLNDGNLLRFDVELLHPLKFPGLSAPHFYPDYYKNLSFRFNLIVCSWNIALHLYICDLYLYRMMCRPCWIQGPRPACLSWLLNQKIWRTFTADIRFVSFFVVVCFVCYWHATCLSQYCPLNIDTSPVVDT